MDMKYKYAKERKVRKPKDRPAWLNVRKRFVTSTQMPGLFGMGKYDSKFALFLMHTGQLEDTFVENERTKVGIAMERTIAQLVSDEIGARVVADRAFYTNHYMGASVDLKVDDPDHKYHGAQVEAKNVDFTVFRDTWVDNGKGDVAPPDHISIQTHSQMQCSGRDLTLLCPLVGGNRLEIVKIERSENMGAMLADAAERFYEDCKAGNRPDPVADDADLLGQFLTQVDEGKTFKANPELAQKIQDHYEIGLRMKEDEALRKQLKAEVMLAADDAVAIFGNGIKMDLGYTQATPPDTITEDMVGQNIGGRAGFRRCTPRPVGGKRKYLEDKEARGDG